MITKERKKWSIAGNIVLGFLAFLAVMPFLLLVIASFTDEQTAIANGYSYFPAKWSLDAYRYLVNEGITIVRAYGITILVTVVGTVCSILMTSMLAYMLSKEGLPGRKVLNFLLVFTMLFSGGQVPSYIIYASVLHIKDTIFALLVPNLMMGAFSVILVRNYFMNSIPKELLEAARIDGAKEWTILYKIVIPLSKPIIATIGMMTAMTYWNDWQNGLYYLNDTKLYSIQNILNAINSSVQFLASNSVTGVRFGDIPSNTVRMAIAVVGILPLVIAYPFFQKYFVKGLTIGSVKG
ncbi:MAG TPA: carbohydrate ABC transporter permease [Candidatus Scybalocola faecigallinarum]|uniref:Carbohydrate ABC transporter permease n=1 Tax=Candidatus Scybalocola faecigallinarum TaxID=2840941 RepID=A0A9D1F594_9FIRM|nr:carbohydrate ABC transporter permease [Candidatus Scybalocola faecigallinarum]